MGPLLGRSLNVWLRVWFSPTHFPGKQAICQGLSAIASEFRIDGAKSPEIPQKEGVLDSEIAARNRRSLATFHRTLKSKCSIALLLSLVSEIAAISGVSDGHRNRKSQNRQQKKTPKEIQHKDLFFCPPLPPSKFFVFAFFLHFKEKNNLNTKNFRG